MKIKYQCINKKNTRLQIERKAQYKRTDTYIYETKKWTVYNDVEDNDFKPIVDKVIELNGCFITGAAGTGKSQLIRQMKTELENKGKTYQCLAPTNLAALNIKGVLFISLFQNLKNWIHYIILMKYQCVKKYFMSFLL